MARSIKTSWNRILKWLGEQSVSITTISPATLKQIKAAEAQFRVTFPDDLKKWYRIANGAENLAVFPSVADDDMAYSPMSLDAAFAEWQTQSDLLNVGQFTDLTAVPDPGVAPGWWNPGWIPFASNGGGDCYCIDTAPTPEGTVGQVIAYSHESGDRKRLAESLTEYLSNLVDLLKDDDARYDDDYGVVLGGEPVYSAEELKVIDEQQAAGRKLFQKDNAIRDAEIAFKEKDFTKVAELLSSYDGQLDPVSQSRLNFAKKKATT